MKLNLFIIAILPALLLITWIYKKDKYEKEPSKLLIKAFFIGCILSIPTIYIQQIMIKIDFSNILISKLYSSFLVSAFIEESLKYMGLIYIIKNKNFNERLDGIVYATFVSLGFATIENIIYIFMANKFNAINVGINRAIISVPAHMLFAITMGYYISLYKFSKNNNYNKKIYLYKSLYMPIILHGIFNFILMVKSRWAMIIFVAYIIYLWKINLDKLDKYAIDSKRIFFKYARRRDDIN